MRHRSGRVALALLLLLAPGLAHAQSSPLTGPNAGAMHGQPTDMRQDLHSAPGPGVADPDRSRRLRDQAGQRQRNVTQRHAATNPPRQRRRNVSPTGAPRQALTGTGSPGGRTTASQARHEAQMAEARRRQMESERRAAEAQDGVRLGR